MLVSSEATPTSILYVQMAVTNHSTILQWWPRRVIICELGDSSAIYFVTGRMQQLSNLKQ